MRTAFLALALLGLSTASAACESQPLLARCETQQDCDRSMSPTSLCVESSTRSGTCLSGNCICCPTAELLAARCSANPMDPICMGCQTMVQPIDVVPVDASDDARGDTDGDAPSDTGDNDAGADTGSDATPVDAAGCSACIKGLQYCDNGTCRALRQLGQSCTAATECMSRQCVSSGAGASLCCDIACTAPGYSCSVPGLEGRCSPLMSMPDAGGMDAARD